jgi:hypothetical protein
MNYIGSALFYPLSQIANFGGPIAEYCAWFCILAFGATAFVHLIYATIVLPLLSSFCMSIRRIGPAPELTESEKEVQTAIANYPGVFPYQSSILVGNWVSTTATLLIFVVAFFVLWLIAEVGLVFVGTTGPQSPNLNGILMSILVLAASTNFTLHIDNDKWDTARTLCVLSLILPVGAIVLKFLTSINSIASSVWDYALVEIGERPVWFLVKIVAVYLFATIGIPLLLTVVGNFGKLIVVKTLAVGKLIALKVFVKWPKLGWAKTFGKIKQKTAAS